MSTDKIDPSKKDVTISSADNLVKTGNSQLELSEEQLEQVTGGGKHIAGVKYEDITINCNTKPSA